MSWAVAITHPNTESRVARDVADLGFEVFGPRIRQSAVHRGRRVYREQPMFPRYLMIRMCANIFEVMAVRYLVNLIRTTSNSPAVVSDLEIKTIKARCTGDDLLIVPRSSRFLVGELVRPKTGALVDMIGKYESSTGLRELADFMLLGREVSVSFRKGELVAA